MKNILSEEKSTRFFKIFRIAVLCGGVAATVLRALSLFFFYDADIGYYQHGSVIPAVANALLAILALFAALSCFLLGKNAPRAEKYTVSGKCSAVFAALAFAAVAVEAGLSSYELLKIYDISDMTPAVLLINLLILVTPIAACAYFVLYALGRLSPAFALMGGFCAVIYFVILLASSYFDISIQMNAPEKLASHLCCVCALLLILNEMRVMCGAQKKAFYLFSVSFSAIALNACALPTAIASLAGVFTGGVITPPDPSAYVFFALGIFSVIRLIMLEPENDAEEKEEQNDASSDNKEQL